MITRSMLIMTALTCSALFADTDQPQPVPQTPQPRGYLPGDEFLPIKNPDQVVHDFRAKYEAAKKPTFLIYINRDLVQQRGELVEMSRVQESTQVKGDTVPTTGSNVQIGANTNATPSNSNNSPVNTGQGGERNDVTSTSTRIVPDSNKGVATVTDFDAREIEETINDRFSQGGAHFVDQQVAATLEKTFASVGNRFLTAPATDAEKDEIDSVKKSASIVIEVLARHKTIVVPTPAGDASVDRLDLVASAYDVRQPGVVLARVSSDNLFGFNKRDGAIREQQASVLTPTDFIDQVTLALMDRMSF